MSKLLLIDGFSLIHRAYHALPNFKTKEGVPTGAVFGFFSMIYKAINDFIPDYVGVAFDTPKPTFRKNLFDKYQAQRPKISDDLKIQIDLIKEGVSKIELKSFAVPGYEGDDVIGSLINRFVNKKELTILIISSDHDTWQLVEERVYVISPKKGISQLEIITSETIKRKLGILPNQLADFKALVGDLSDNYPGVPGVGPKTARELLNNYRNIDQIFENISQIDHKLRKNLLDNKEMVFLSLRLAKIVKNLDFSGVSLDDLKFKGFSIEFKNFLQKYQMISLIKRIFYKNQKKYKKNSTIGFSKELQVNNSKKNINDFNQLGLF